MFTGQSSHTLDAKNRLIIPVRYRSSLGSRFYISRSINALKCIWIMPEKAFENMILGFSSKIQATDTRGQRWLANIVSNAYLCEPDKQGRILVPQSLRDVCEVNEDNVTIIGVISRLELWNSSKLNEMNSDGFESDSEFVNAKYSI